MGCRLHRTPRDNATVVESLWSVFPAGEVMWLALIWRLHIRKDKRTMQALHRSPRRTPSADADVRVREIPTVGEHAGVRPGTYLILNGESPLQELQTGLQVATLETDVRELLEHCAYALTDFALGRDGILPRREERQDQVRRDVGPLKAATTRCLDTPTPHLQKEDTRGSSFVSRAWGLLQTGKHVPAKTTQGSVGRRRGLA